MPVTAPTLGNWRPNTDPADAHGRAMKSLCSIAGVRTSGKSLAPSQGGFDLRLVGHAKGGNLLYNGQYTRLQSSSSYNNTNVWHRRIGHDGSDVHRGENERLSLVSVRCKKN